jgi:multicomponent Na+:H+ antiporter subunit C
MEPWQIYVGAAVISMLIGVACIASKTSMMKTIIGLEIITSAVNLNFIALGWRETGVDPLAQSFAITSIVIGASVAAVALSIMINAFRHYGSLDLKKMRRLRW